MNGEEAWNKLLVCERCEGPLSAPGALVFSPPYDLVNVRKHHVCADCYRSLVAWLAT